MSQALITHVTQHVRPGAVAILSRGGHALFCQELGFARVFAIDVSRCPIWTARTKWAFVLRIRWPRS